MPPYEWYNKTDFLSNYSVILPFETNWDRLEHYVWYRRYGKVLSYYGAVLYILAVHMLPKVMAHRKQGFQLRLPLTIFNFGLAIFSLVGAVRMGGELYRVMSRHGFVHSVCIASYVEDQVAVQWIKFFCWSKYIELIDTLFLILRKRPVTFLHWYHHATVLVFTWHGMHTLTAAGRWFSTMNYVVHAVMYSYFAWRSMGHGCPRWISMSITSMQLMQMVAGCVLGYTIYSVKSNNGVCHHTWENLYMAIGIYSTYLYLFAEYFYFAYIRSSFDRRCAAKLTAAALPCAVGQMAIDEQTPKEEEHRREEKVKPAEDDSFAKECKKESRGRYTINGDIVENGRKRLIKG